MSGLFYRFNILSLGMLGKEHFFDCEEEKERRRCTIRIIYMGMNREKETREN